MHPPQPCRNIRRSGPDQASRAQQAREAERGQRRLAVTRAVEAGAARERADVQKELAEQRLVRLSVANGQRLVEEGDPSGALPWFAQAVGLVFAGVGLVGLTLGPHWLGLAATGAALAAAFLNAAFGYCLGCEMYLLVRRVTVRAG